MSKKSHRSVYHRFHQACLQATRKAVRDLDIGPHAVMSTTGRLGNCSLETTEEVRTISPARASNGFNAVYFIEHVIIELRKILKATRVSPLRVAGKESSCSARYLFTVRLADTNYDDLLPLEMCIKKDGGLITIVGQ